MLRRTQFFRSPAYSLCRRYSTPTPAPYGDVFKNNKLRAFKFESTPEEALRNMGAWAGALNSSAPSDFLHSLGSLFLPFLETKPPTRWSAVYFPVWIINLEADGESTNGERHTCHLGNDCLPGADTPLLSVAPLSLRGSSSPAVPFTEDLLHQQGQDVQCIPFDISPFSPFQALQSCDPDATWDVIRGCSVRTASIKTHMFAAYPILLPLYVAQYQIGENPARMITLFTSGSANCTDVMAPNFQGYNEILDMVYAYLRKKGSIDMDLDAEVRTFLPNRPRKRGIASTLDKMHNSSNISYLASMGPLASDDDPRVREWTKENSAEMKRYFDLLSEILMLEQIIKTTNGANPSTKVLSFGGGNAPRLQGVEDTTKMLKGKLEELEEEKRKAKPQWWIEWESSSRSEPQSK